VDRGGQQQVLRATFPGIPTEFENFSRCEWMHWRVPDAAKKATIAAGATMRVTVNIKRTRWGKFHETHHMKVKDEIERLVKEYDKLKEPWLFVSR
jgi:hypothetical protein